jgi:hypothetical protein
VLPSAYKARVVTGGPFGALPCFVATVALVLLLLSGAARGAGSQTLYASFNSDGSMRLNLGDGSPAGAIPPGPYTVIVNNSTVGDNFGDTHKVHLFGPGVDYSTVLTQEEETQAIWSVTFQPSSTYTFQDDYRPTVVHVVFATSAAGTGSSTPVVVSTPSSSTAKHSGSVSTNSDLAGSAVLQFRGRLTGVVSAARKLTLDYKGKAVATLRAGKYTVSVDDQSGKSGFQLQRIHAAPTTVTSAAFVGKKSVTVALKAGQWWFSTSGGTKSYFIVVN